MTTSENKRGFFVSDLHLFSRRSSANDLMPELRTKVRRAHTLVLGGDIFDFKWSTHASLEHSLDMAVEWLDDLHAENRDCDFHFVLGNHDCEPSFVERLEQFAKERSHFAWHRYFLRLETCLFFHGDIVSNGAHDHDVLDGLRLKHRHTKNKGEAWHVAYDVAVRVRLHRLAMLTIREFAILERVRAYAETIHQGADDGVTDVYFGHTHVDVDGVEFGGLRFHNGGGAIRGIPFRIVETTMQERDR